MKTLVKVALFALIFYFLFWRPREDFALPTNAVTDWKLLKPELYYFKGVRKVSNTIEKPMNGGKECQEFNEVVYTVAPAVDAKCRGENDIAYYNLETVSKKGKDIILEIEKPTPFKEAFVRNNFGGRCWNVEGGSKDDNARLVQYGGGKGYDCEGSWNNIFTYDGNNIINKNSGKCFYPGGTTLNSANAAEIKQAPCRASQAPGGLPVWTFNPAKGYWKSNETGKCVGIYGGLNNLGNDTPLIMWDCIENDQTQNYGVFYNQYPGSYYNFGV